MELQYDSPWLEDERSTITFVSLDLTYQVKTMTASTVFKKQFSFFSNINASGSKFDFDVK